MKSIQLHHKDNLELMATLPDESIDIIFIDPPYLYLKKQKLERSFDEIKFFSECKRLLKNKGSLVQFGRGLTFYKRNILLDEIGLIFKEEIIWDKRRSSSPVSSIGRIHETISIFSKNGKINKVKVPILEKHEYHPEKIDMILKRISSSFGNKKSFDLLKRYYDEKHIEYRGYEPSRYNVTVSSNKNRTVTSAVALEEGGLEQTIIPCASEHYGSIHPTQKPVKLIQRILNLVVPEGVDKRDVVVADFFGGSMSTMEAVYKMGMRGISSEIDEEYFRLGKERIDNLTANYIL